MILGRASCWGGALLLGATLQRSYDDAMSVLIGIACFIVAAVCAFRGYALLAVLFILIGAYPISRVIACHVNATLSKSSYGRQVLRIARHRKYMKEHGLSERPVKEWNRKARKSHAVMAGFFGDDFVPTAGLNTICPVCDTEVTENESVCDSCCQHVHNSCVKICYFCNHTYCNNCLAGRGNKCLNCGSKVGDYSLT